MKKIPLWLILTAGGVAVYLLTRKRTPILNGLGETDPITAKLFEMSSGTSDVETRKCWLSGGNPTRQSNGSYACVSEKCPPGLEMTYFNPGTKCVSKQDEENERKKITDFASACLRAGGNISMVDINGPNKMACDMKNGKRLRTIEELSQ